MDTEWEKLRFLKRPHPTEGVGAWDEGNVREAASVRKGRNRRASQFTVADFLNVATKREVS